MLISPHRNRCEVPVVKACDGQLTATASILWVSLGVQPEPKHCDSTGNPVLFLNSPSLQVVLCNGTRRNFGRLVALFNLKVDFVGEMRMEESLTDYGE